MNYLAHRYSPLPSPPPDKSLFASDLSRFALKLGSFRSQDQPVAASFPSPPMSGSPPPPTPPETSRTSSFTRKRSLSPSSGTAVPRYQPVTTAPRETYTNPARFGEIQPYTSSTFSPHLPSLAGGYQATGSYPPPLPFQPTYGSGYHATPPGPPGPALFPPGATLPSQHDTPSALRTARKPKAHVASACVNCKKKHLRCDNARPCRRCIQSGKEDSCVDVTHKKRGRPPLKADDNPPRRPYETSLGPLTAPPPAPPARQLSSAQPSYGQQGGLPEPRGLAPLPPPPPTAGERRRPPPLFQAFHAPAPPPAQPYQPSQPTPAGATGHRHFSSESSSSSNRPISPYFSSPLHSPLGIPQQRLDAYGRPYPVPSTAYSLPVSTTAQTRPYHSLVSAVSSSPSTTPHQVQPSFRDQQLPPPPMVQLPPIQQPQSVTGLEQRRGTASSASSGQSVVLQPQESQSDDLSGREAKRQRMDLGGMLRRTTEP